MGDNSDEKNAIIESSSLGYEDHGILTIYLGLNYGGSGQSFGGYGLDNYDKEKDRRVGTAYGTQFIIEVLKVVGVEKWEDLKGKYVRVRSSRSKVFAIGHILEDRWFYPENLFHDMQYAEGASK